MKRLQSQRGEERVQGKLCCMKQSAKHGKRSMKCKVSGLERTKLIEVFREVFKLGVERENYCLLFIW